MMAVNHPHPVALSANCTQRVPARRSTINERALCCFQAPRACTADRPALLPTARPLPAAPFAGAPASSAAAAARRRTPLARPAAFGPDFVAAPACVPCHLEAVAPKYRGLSPQQLEQAFRAEHPGLLEALAGATASMAPASAPRLLRHLEAELPPALTDVAPSGDCVLVALPPGLLPLLERAADCCEASLAAGEPRLAATTATAALSLLSSLAFADGESAAGYACVAVRCKQALKAAYDAGADIVQEDVVELYSSCARASPFLWLTTYAGNRYAAAVDEFASAGWASAQLSVRFTEAYCRLVGRGRLCQVEERFVRVVKAAMARHPLSLAHTQRLLAAAAALPVEMRIQLSLHARSHPAADWHSQLLAMHSLRQQEEALQKEQQQAAAAAPRHRSATPGLVSAAPLMAHARAGKVARRS